MKMIRNLMNALTEQTAGLDGSVTHGEFLPSKDVVMPLDPERRADLESYVLQHTSEAHTYNTARGGKGIVYLDERGRSSASLVSELSDECLVFLAKQKGYEFPEEAKPVGDEVGAGYPVPQTEAVLTEGLLSRKKLYVALQELVGMGLEPRGTLPSSYTKLSNEIYGKKAMIYFTWKDEPTRRKAERELENRGFKVHRRYYPGSGTMEVQVSYFKGHHWDEEVETEVGSILAEAKGKKVPGADNPEADSLKDVTFQQKPGKDYWYLKRGAVTLGVISKDDEGRFDADTDPEGEGKYKQGFKSKEDAARWILAKNESLGEARDVKLQTIDWWRSMPPSEQKRVAEILGLAAADSRKWKPGDTAKAIGHYRKFYEGRMVAANLAEGMWDESKQIELHKKAGKAMTTVKGTEGRTFGDGWATSVSMGPGRRQQVYLSVGINNYPKVGGHIVWLGVDLAGYGQDRGRVAQQVERDELKRVSAAMKRYAISVETFSGQNGVARASAKVMPDQMGKLAKALPAIAKKFAEDLWKRVSQMEVTESEDLHERMEVIHPYANGMWTIRVEDELKKRTGYQYTWKKPILRDGANALIYAWAGRRTKGQMIPRTFRLRLDYDVGRDLFDATMTLYDGQGEKVQEKVVRGLYIDQVTDPQVLTSWIRRQK